MHGSAQPLPPPWIRCHAFKMLGACSRPPRQGILPTKHTVWYIYNTHQVGKQKHIEQKEKVSVQVPSHGSRWENDPVPSPPSSLPKMPRWLGAGEESFCMVGGSSSGKKGGKRQAADIEQESCLSVLVCPGSIYIRCWGKVTYTGMHVTQKNVQSQGY